MTRSLIILSAKAAMLAGVAAGALFLGVPDVAHAQGSGAGGSEAAGGAGGNPDAGPGSGGNPDAGSGAGGNSAAGAGGSETGGGSGDSGRPDDKGGQPEGAGGGDGDSDRPDWAGTPGGSAGRGAPPDAGGGGDLYGDLYVILRDAQGVPILNADGFVQPIDADGNLIPLDAEGAILPEFEDLAQEVDFGRLSVSRAPEDVLEGRSEEVLAALNAATEVTLDPAGRLVVTIDGETRTIDAPLENLSIYIALMETGTIEGVQNDALASLSFLTDGVQTAEDLEAAVSFLAAASDKTGVLTNDEVAYLNLILDINPTTIEGTAVQYSDVDFTSFTYDRATTYDGVTTTILVEQADGTWVEQEIDVYTYVFADTNDAATDGTLDAFAQAADDARVVINYLHEYAVPVPPDEL